MQDLWGRILAGEVQKPNSYSLKTLDILRNLSKTEAELFEKVSKYALEDNNIWFIPVFDKEFLKSSLEIFPGNHFVLGEIGLMYQTDLTIQMFMNGAKQNSIKNERHIIIANKTEATKDLRMPIWKYTTAGSELISLVEKQYNESYFERIAKYFLDNNCEVITGDIIEKLPDGRISYNEINKYTKEKST